MKEINGIPIFLFAILLLVPGMVMAHGVHHTITKKRGICASAAYDSGEPMAGAPVLVFEPDQEKASWESVTDPRGEVCFAPHRDGIWVLQIRDSSGHGARINIPVNKNETVSASSQTGALSLKQKIIMGLVFAWGCLGTALFFTRKRNAHK